MPENYTYEDSFPITLPPNMVRDDRQSFQRGPRNGSAAVEESKQSNGDTQNSRGK